MIFSKSMAHGGKREGAGRKKGLASVLAEHTRNYIAVRVKKEQGPIIKKAIDQAKAGDAAARAWLYERAFGKAVQPIEGPEDGLMPVLVQFLQVDATQDDNTTK